MEIIIILLQIITMALIVKPSQKEDKGSFYLPPKETVGEKMVKRGIREAINEQTND